MYFTMSMLANTDEDGIHWPMILNVPGEGFGDDFLQKYSNHSLLTDDDDYIFLLDEALEAMGRTCEKTEGGGGGPPTGEMEHIPSNLEVDPNAWIHNVYTFSPVWEPPAPEPMVSEESTASASGMAIVEEGKVRVSSCYHEDVNAVELHVDFMDVSMENGLPWMALGYRPTEECLMIPRGGDTSDIILLSSTGEAEEEIIASKGVITSELKSFSESAVSSVYGNLTPLVDTEGYSNVQVVVPTMESTTAISPRSTNNPALSLHFTKAMDEKPNVMYLMYAVGSSPQLGYHSSRACFEVTEFPKCPTGEEADMSTSEVEEQNMDSTTQSEQDTTTNDEETVVQKDAVKSGSSTTTVVSLSLAMIMLAVMGMAF